jgi:pyruvate decarboxylase
LALFKRSYFWLHFAIHSKRWPCSESGHQLLFFATLLSRRRFHNLPHRTRVEINGAAEDENSGYFHIKPLLRKLLSQLDEGKLPKHNPSPDLPNPVEELMALPPSEPAGHIDQETFWHHISNFFRVGDIVLTETGTASVGSRHMVLPPKSTLINSSIWLSIGYMLPAAAGAAAAQREMVAAGTRPRARTILFEGDGSFQMTAQATSDIIRARLDMTIFVLNNNGYTSERWIHGMRAPYNDIMPWRYLESPNFFGAPTDGATYPIHTKRAANWGELDEILADHKFSRGRGLSIIEIMMVQDDAPETLKIMAQSASKRNASQNAAEGFPGRSLSKDYKFT